MRKFIPVLALLCVAAVPARAHELWVEPLAYEIEQDGILQADLVNGQNFAGTILSFIPGRFVRFELAFGDRSFPVENRIGNRPALDQPAPAKGLAVVIYESEVSKVSYETLEKFLSFAHHKDFPDAESMHRAQGFAETDFAEAYTRYSKALIAVGDGAGADFRTGLETEIVALANPYFDSLDGVMPVQVFYGDAVRADAQVELFDKAPDGTVEITLHRTDADGIANLPVQPGHAYMADAVVLRLPDEALAAERGVVWETLWAELNFAVPAP